jgi:hypothetical protein
VTIGVTQANPISGAQSLVFTTQGYGQGILWHGRRLTPAVRATSFVGSARVRVTTASTSQLCLRALIEYTGGSADRCTYVSGAAGDKGVVTVAVPFDVPRDVTRVRIGVYQEGGAALSGVMLDDASAVLVPPAALRR